MNAPLPPAAGKCRWLRSCPVTGHRVLEITVDTQKGPVSRTYEVQQAPKGYLLTTIDNDYNLVQYEVNHVAGVQGVLLCNCPDSKRRPCRCKHVQALKAALTALPF